MKSGVVRWGVEGLRIDCWELKEVGRQVRNEGKRTGSGSILLSGDKVKDRIPRGGPWSFDNQLLVLLKPECIRELEALDLTFSSIWIQIHKVPLVCMTHKVAEYLGNKIGKMVEVDLGALGDCEGKFLRVRVKINLYEPLQVGFKVDFKEAGHKVPLVIQYERLPDFCFYCGGIGHRYVDCVLLEGKEVDPSTFIYGNRLRANHLPLQRPRNERMEEMIRSPYRRGEMGRGRNMRGGPAWGTSLTTPPITAREGFFGRRSRFSGPYQSYPNRK
ncbi:hypothetical protein Scep_024598 [Stephania cephalantha]|uniref:CCHC-type domain-containing protein n=1 Tax=Stephania cephalantha TaxID=152367 RepID=A0AAP0F432_9MAGN